MNELVSAAPLIGRELSHYRIVEKIGEGGMGQVFLAHDEHLGHGVALKVLPSDTDDHSRQLFRKEAHALSKLNHPNIVTVLDFDTQEDLDFLVMEYVPGQALDEKVREGALPEIQVIRIGLQLAEGLAAAHEQGVVHRDLKPGNLRLTNDDRLKILDFGLARSTLSFSPMATTVSLEGPAECSGTLPYMAAEQVLGQAADARTDIYSAGAVLYELCTGRPPFEQRLLTGLVDDILHRQPTPPSRCRPGISPRFEAIILKCLEKDPDKRYQKANELVHALHELRQQSKPPVKRTRWLKAGIYALICILGVALALPRIVRHFWPLPRIESLAVLPFANLSGDSQQDYLADGMTDFLITDLGQMHTLQKIISRTSVMQYKTERRPLREISRQLNVDALVEGSVTRSDNTLRVRVRLVLGDDRELWSHSYEGAYRDLPAMQEELALGISREIKTNFTEENRGRLARARPVEPAVQEAYLKGKHMQFGNAEQRVKARRYFEQALQHDPAYAPAYAGLADSYWNDISLPTRQTMPKARDYAEKAISLDGKLAHAHTSLATVLFYGSWDWAAADHEYQRAIELNPNDAEAHRMYSVFLTAMGRFDEALAHVRSARGMDPLYSGNDTTEGWDLYCARRYDEALQSCQKAQELTPNDETLHGCLSYSYLGKGQSLEAIEEARKAWTLSDEQPVWAVLLGRAHVQRGDIAEARELLDQLLRKSAKTYVPPSFLATLFTAIGDKEKALQWLDRAYAERDLYLAGIKVDPAFDPLRADARFQALSRQMGLLP